MTQEEEKKEILKVIYQAKLEFIKGYCDTSVVLFQDVIVKIHEYEMKYSKYYDIAKQIEETFRDLE